MPLVRLRRPRVWNGVCVSRTRCDGASERLVGVRDCSRQYGFQLPLLLKLFSHQSCGHQQLDMLSLLLGRSRPDGQLVKVFSALLVRIVRDDTSQLVVAQANRVVRMLV